MRAVVELLKATANTAPNFRCSSCNSQGGTYKPDDSIHLHDGQAEEVKNFGYLCDVLDRSCEKQNSLGMVQMERAL